MPFPCKTCNHPERAAIDAALAGGATIQGTAASYGLNAQALTRHRLHHLNPTVALVRKELRAKLESELVVERTVKDRVVKLVDKLELLAFTDLEEEDDEGNVVRRVRHDFLDVAAELRKTLEFMAKMSGEVGPSSQTTVQVLNVTQSPDFQATVARLMRALAPYPEARAAAVAALGEDA